MRKFIGVAAGLMLWPFPELVGLLVFLWLFWEHLGDLTLRIYDDFQLEKTEDALKKSVSAEVDGYYVHMLTMKSVAERERRSKAKLARTRRIRAIHRAIAPLSTWVGNLIQRWQTVPMLPAAEEE